MVKVTIDKEECIGCGSCAALCPAGFEMADGKAKVKSQKAKCIKEAADSCPVQAISVK
jgi:ferredoxin